jgi:hypothetical protein
VRFDAADHDLLDVPARELRLEVVGAARAEAHLLDGLRLRRDVRDYLFRRVLEAARVLLGDYDGHFEQARALDRFSYARGDLRKIGYDPPKSFLHIYHGKGRVLARKLAYLIHDFIPVF